MSISFFKIFFSKRKENKWLNQLGQKGLLLEKVYDSKYLFTKNESMKYSYLIEYLDCSPSSDDGKSIIDEHSQHGVRPVATSGNWVYFVSDSNDIHQSKSVLKKNSIPYFWRAFYFMFFAICGAVVCGYQFFAVEHLDKIKHVSDGVLSHFEIESTGTAFDKILKLIVVPFNMIIDLLNTTYISLFTNIFGKNDAVVVIALLLPAVIILTVLAAMNISEFISYFSKYSKKLRIRN